MDYKIIDVEGIGAIYAELLQQAGIDTATQLLERCRTPRGRKEIAEATGISPKLILRWTNHADLYRIDGVGPQFAELLEAAGVDTVKELRHRNAENLEFRIRSVNDERHLTGRVPTTAMLQKMIDQAAELPPMMEY